jgi:hypothetical protein
MESLLPEYSAVKCARLLAVPAELRQQCLSMCIGYVLVAGNGDSILNV